MHGVVVIDKPAGMTSARVVDRVKRALGVKRVGHTGTLDPMATGVLPLCLGEGTKIAQYLLAEDKRYTGELMLGIETDTLDADGTVTAETPDRARDVTEDQLRDAIAGLVGPGEQIPPMFSALKHKGKRLHELARAGKVVDRPPRPIVIHAMTLDRCDLPTARFSVHCSKGTYVRSLVRDLGHALGCGAHLTALRRVQSGAFDLSSAIELAEINTQQVEQRVISPADALPHLPAVTVPAERVAAVANGKPLAWRELTDAPAPAELARLRLPTGELVALVSVDDAGRVRYRRVFTYGLTKP